MSHRTCAVQDCTQPTRSKGCDLCNKHYFRWYRHGRLETYHEFGIRVSKGRRTKTTQQPTHILAPPSGRMYVHRVVHYDEIGHGPHRCYWCGCAVNWNQPTHALVVDHLDGDQANNHPSNLVTSCAPCNTRRGTRLKAQANTLTAWSGVGAEAVKRTLKRAG